MDANLSLAQGFLARIPEGEVAGLHGRCPGDLGLCSRRWSVSP